MSYSPDFSQPENAPFQPPTASPSSTGTSGKAIASLILGLVSIVGMCFTGIPGLILGIMGLGDINRSQGRVGGKGLAIVGIVLSSLGTLWTIIALLIAMLLPAVQAVRQAARKVQSSNNIRQQSLAILSYESANQQFPLRDKNGLSWRVHMLPFIECSDLYDRFNLDEPWDSPNNIQLLDEMPDIYDCPTVDLKPGFTVYQVPYTDMATNSDPQSVALFDNSGKGLTFGEISDGASFTAMILEVNPEAAVEWTKPADWEFDPTDPMRDLGEVNPGTINVGFADGSVQQVPSFTDSETMKGIMTRAGGEKLPADFGY